MHIKIGPSVAFLFLALFFGWAKLDNPTEHVPLAPMLVARRGLRGTRRSPRWGVPGNHISAGALTNAIIRQGGLPSLPTLRNIIRDVVLVSFTQT